MLELQEMLTSRKKMDEEEKPKDGALGYTAKNSASAGRMF